MHLSRWMAIGAVLSASVGGCGGNASTLQEPSAPLDADIEANSDVQEPPDTSVQEEADASAQDAAEEPSEPLADPFRPPAGGISSWTGKLPPGGLFDPSVIVTYPSDASPENPYPLIVFAHGFMLGEGDYTATFEHLAKFGYVVASVGYASNPLDQDHHAPVQSMIAAIDMLTNSPPEQLGAIVNPDKIGAMGHSLGAKAAVWAAIEEPRIQAVLALDPVDDDPSPFGGGSAKRPSITPERMPDLHVPVFYIATELGPQGSPPCAPKASDACRFFEATSEGMGAWIAVVKDFGHQQFIDSYSCLLCGSCARGSQSGHSANQLVVRGLAVAYWQATFKGQSGYMSYLQGDELQSLRNQNRLLDEASQQTFCTP